jgi:bacterioferritin-associated ferredoxin
MTAIKPDTENDVLCYCSGTTVQQIKQLLDNGIIDPERISRITGAASGCGGCEFEFQQLVAEHTQEA